MNRTGRSHREQAASGWRSFRSSGGAPAHGEVDRLHVADSVFQIAAHEETIPLEELYGACQVAREARTGRHAVGRVIARPFVGEPERLHEDAESPRLLARASAPNYLTTIREAEHTVYGVGKISDIFAGQDVDESRPTKSNVDGINATIELLEAIDGGFVFVNLVETDMLWGTATTWPVLPLPPGLRPPPAGHPRSLAHGRSSSITSDHGCDPTTPSTDHSREHALARICGRRNAAGRVHEEGEFADVGATVNAWLGGRTQGRRLPAGRSSFDQRPTPFESSTSPAGLAARRRPVVFVAEKTA